MRLKSIQPMQFQTAINWTSNTDLSEIQPWITGTSHRLPSKWVLNLYGSFERSACPVNATIGWSHNNCRPAWLVLVYAVCRYANYLECFQQTKKGVCTRPQDPCIVEQPTETSRPWKAIQGILVAPVSTHITGNDRCRRCGCNVRNGNLIISPCLSLSRFVYCWWSMYIFGRRRVFHIPSN